MGLRESFFFLFKDVTDKWVKHEWEGEYSEVVVNVWMGGVSKSPSAAGCAHMHVIFRVCWGSLFSWLLFFFLLSEVGVKVMGLHITPKSSLKQIFDSGFSLSSWVHLIMLGNCI